MLKGLEEAAEELSKGEEEFDAIINPVTHPEWATSAMVYAWVRASRDLDNERTDGEVGVTDHLLDANALIDYFRRHKVNAQLFETT